MPLLKHIFSMLLSKDDLELHANNMELPLRLLILRTSRPPGLPLRARAFLCRFRSGVLHALWSACLHSTGKPCHFMEEYRHMTALVPARRHMKIERLKNGHRGCHFPRCFGANTWPLYPFQKVAPPPGTWLSLQTTTLGMRQNAKPHPS